MSLLNQIQQALNRYEGTVKSRERRNDAKLEYFDELLSYAHDLEDVLDALKDRKLSNKKITVDSRDCPEPVPYNIKYDVGL